MEEQKYRVADLLADALLDLMREKLYQDISVTDVVTKANVARVSFYRNFESTNDILYYIISKAVSDFSSSIRPVLINNDTRKIRDLLFHLIYKMKSERYHIDDIFPANLSVLLSGIEDTIGIFENELPFDNITEKYRISARTGLICNVLRAWLNSNMQDSPEVIVDYLVDKLITI